MLGEPYYRRTEVHPSVRKMQLARRCLRAEEEPPRPKETHMAQAARAWPHQRACLSGGSIGNPCGLSTPCPLCRQKGEPEWKVQSLHQGPAPRLQPRRCPALRSVVVGTTMRTPGTKRPPRLAWEKIGSLLSGLILCKDSQLREHQCGLLRG